MAAVLLTGYGAFEALEYHTDVPMSEPKPAEVLIRVAAAGTNNTGIDTRIGWRPKRVTDESRPAQGRMPPPAGPARPLLFRASRVSNVCGHIVAAGKHPAPRAGRVEDRSPNV
ncbi:MAG: hypothetical protein AB7O95_24285 [Geminicoccaceae bacterium]